MNLDVYQRVAATSDKTRICVSAVPGSGKTRTIVARVKHMIEECNYLRSEIAMFTFTRHAANEMRERLDAEGIRGVQIGTFHKVALSIIQKYGRRQGWDPEWLTILDELDVAREEDDVLVSLGFKKRKGGWRRGLTSAHWKRYRDAIVNGDPIPPDQETLGLAWRAFMDMLRAENVLTFGTLILEAIALLERIDAESIRSDFRHILVDEAQDSDANQWRFVDLLQPDTLFVVGDVDQSIYEWRGSRPSLFIEYSETAKVFSLPNSYRFGFNIASPANILIKENHDRLDTAINAIASNSGSVTVVKDAAMEAVKELITEELLTREPKDICVLARTHSSLFELDAALLGSEVKYARIGSKSDMYKSSEFRAVRSYLRLACNPRDRRAFMGIVMSEGLSTSDVTTVKRKALAGRTSLRDAYNKVLPGEIEDVAEYLAIHDSEHDYSEALQYVRDVAFSEALIEVQDIVNCLAMESVQDRLREVEAECVTLCTIHAAKGLEWPVVFILGMNSKQFPSPRSVKDGREEEERRLCYVAMTRAEEKLYLVKSATHTAEDGASRFLMQMGELDTFTPDPWGGDDLAM